MDQFAQFFERWYAALQRFSSELSAHWQRHTNRRTIIIILIAGALSIYLYLYVVQPPDNFPIDQIISVPAGDSVSQIGELLREDGVVRSPLAFHAVVFLLGRERQLRAGDYLFKEPEDVFSIARALGFGAYGLEPAHIRIPEAATTKEMSLLIAEQIPNFDKTTFLAEAQPMEGYLFPDTYFFLPNVTPQQAIQTMRQNFDTQIATITPEIQASGHSLSDIVIMASIIEREAPDMQDRRMIAGVLWRRIKMGLDLQTDVTFTYIGENPSSLTMAELQSDSPYNTYMHTGLPPTPIGSPSLDALEAAATPIDKGYLFYLADSSGVTHYSKTYAGQLANERKYLGE